MEKIRKAKLVRIISFVLGLVVIGVFIYLAFRYGYLGKDVESIFGKGVLKYGYVAVFIFSFLLEAAPQPFASSLVPLAIGVLVGLDFEALIAYTLIAVVLASLVSYWVGIFFGKRIVVKIVGKERFLSYELYFQKYGKAAMIILAVTPIPYFPILGGIFKMKFNDFVVYAVIPRIAQVIAYGYVISWVL
ncbi:MAG: VTT domain-containing protein [archaeon]